jgi:hypothetical protein
MVYRALCRVLRRGGDGGVCWKWRKHTSSTCVWKASISSQRLRMRSSSLGKSIDIVAGVGEEDRHGRGEYFVPCIGPRLTQAVRGARRGAAFAPSVPPTTVHRHRPPPTTTTALVTAFDLSSSTRASSVQTITAATRAGVCLCCCFIMRSLGASPFVTRRWRQPH